MKKRSSLSERLYIILNFLMVLMYALGGILMFFWQIPSVPVSSRRFFGIVLLLYSAYRGFVLFKKIRNAN